ncbi:MAG: bile acid:sodium symporter [Propionibacteriaceae bacterium]|jgi:sodium/bile acid cotransporter 7|nr:bile acid:sodium symporter [Propionibacteriaceae bacterium]
MRRSPIDPFLLAIIAAAVIGTLLPVQGWGVDAFEWLINVAIFALFFLFGTRLSPAETLAGLKNWRLHLTILGFTYVLFPLLGLAIRFLAPELLSPGLLLGIVFLTLVPSTVQSSVAFTSIAKGNVAAAVVSASASNILGVFLTPLLTFLVLSSEHFTISAAAVLDIALQIFAPFVLGQLLRRWTAKWVLAHPQTKLVDRGVVVLVVYSAFASGMREGIWTQVTWVEILIVIALALALLGIMLPLTWYLARRLGFSIADAIAIQFCGTKKSLATGLPMAGVLFAGTPVGLVILPLVIFHQAQLMACATLAARYAKREDAKSPG